MPFCNFVQTYEMQRLILIILSSFFLMISCNKSKPKGILSEKTMVNLMTDVHLVDGYLNTLSTDSTRKVIDGLYEQVFEKYDIDSTTFKTNVTYYLSNPIISTDIYEQVTKNLNVYEADYRRTDSLRNARMSDSVSVAQRYERLKDAAHKLILDVHVDTIPLTYPVHQKDFLDGAGLYMIQIYQPKALVSEKDSSDRSNVHKDSVQNVNEGGAGALHAPIQRNRPASVRAPKPKEIETKPLEN